MNNVDPRIVSMVQREAERLTRTNAEELQSVIHECCGEWVHTAVIERVLVEMVRGGGWSKVRVTLYCKGERG